MIDFPGCARWWWLAVTSRGNPGHLGKRENNVPCVRNGHACFAVIIFTESEWVEDNKLSTVDNYTNYQEYNFPAYMVLQGLRQ